MKEESNDVMALTKELHGDALGRWDDAKRKDFVEMFKKRISASQYILTKTSNEVWRTAFKRQFVSDKQKSKVSRLVFDGSYDSITDGDSTSYNTIYHSPSTIGGRRIDELNQIASERAENILAGLPPLKKAVEYISLEVSGYIAKREELLEAGKELMAQAEEISGELDIEDFPGTMTLADFKAQINAREEKRNDLLDRMDKIGNEGLILGRKIDKFLYAGLPGLSDAVVDVVNGLREKSTALGNLYRRVSEQVQFGDSEAALSILAGFEKDELDVSEDVKNKFSQAIEALKAAGQPKRKALKKGK